MQRRLGAWGIAAVVILLCVEPSAFAGGSKIGVMVDAGVPDGMTGSLVYRPATWLNVHGGGGHNLISPGVRAGASVYLLPTAVAPSVSLEAGHYFRGNANTAMARIGIGDGTDDPLLREVGYDYANLHIGIDVGRDRFSFYLHAGFSYISGTLRNLDEVIESDINDQIEDVMSSGTEIPEQNITVEVRSAPTITIIAPSARLGMIVYF